MMALWMWHRYDCFHHLQNELVELDELKIANHRFSTQFTCDSMFSWIRLECGTVYKSRISISNDISPQNIQCFNSVEFLRLSHAIHVRLKSFRQISMPLKLLTLVKWLKSISFSYRDFDGWIIKKKNQIKKKQKKNIYWKQWNAVGKNSTQFHLNFSSHFIPYQITNGNVTRINAWA